MSFTTPCFIRKNTPSLRNKLRYLGYKVSPDILNFPYLSAGDGLAVPTDNINHNRGYDCGTNESLFLAIAALQDNTSISQYWVFDEDFEYHKKGDFIMGAFYRCSCYCHVATVPEIIEHFKTE